MRSRKTRKKRRHQPLRQHTSCKSCPTFVQTLNGICEDEFEEIPKRPREGGGYRKQEARRGRWVSLTWERAHICSDAGAVSSKKCVISLRKIRMVAPSTEVWRRGLHSLLTRYAPSKGDVVLSGKELFASCTLFFGLNATKVVWRRSRCNKKNASYSLRSPCSGPCPL